MLELARRLVKGIEGVIAAHHLPWHVVNVGARVEFVCADNPSTNGTEARVAMNPKLEAAIHLALVNRAILLAPFHNMMLLSPVTTEGQVDRLVHELDTYYKRIAGVSILIKRAVSSAIIAPRSEAEAFFAANPNIDAIDMIYTDFGGVPRGKRLRQHEVMAVYETGRMFPGSITVVDITGQDTVETGLGLGRRRCRSVDEADPRNTRQNALGGR